MKSEIDSSSELEVSLKSIRLDGKEEKSEENPEQVAEEAPQDDNLPLTTRAYADPQNFLIKHPLQNRWTLWYDRTDGRVNQHVWQSNLKKVVTFDTVEDFWRVFNNIRPASELALGSNYHLFKENIEPTWEHSDNRVGGKWVVNAKKDKLDSMWLYSVLACIGEAYEFENEICGSVVSIRKMNRIALWTRNATQEPVQKSIGVSFKRYLELPANEVIGYQVHDDALKHLSSYKNKDRYNV